MSKPRLTKSRLAIGGAAGVVLAAIVGWGISALDLVTVEPEPEPPRPMRVYVWTGPEREPAAASCVCFGE